MSDNTYLESTDMRKNFKACKKAYFKLWEEREKLKQENKQLREALKKCIPFEIGGYDVRMEECIFCNTEGHTEDCEYIKLTEVQE